MTRVKRGHTRVENVYRLQDEWKSSKKSAPSLWRGQIKSLTMPVKFWSSLPTYYNLTFNPLNTELNPICHLLVLLGDLKFIGPCIVSISNKMQR
jgi:hypothetical protein